MRILYRRQPLQRRIDMEEVEVQPPINVNKTVQAAIRPLSIGSVLYVDRARPF